MSLFFIPATSFAQVVITEIMYDLEGSDADREWVEIYNAGTNPVDLKDWKFNDGSNHVLNEPSKNGGTGSLMLPAGVYAILTSDAVQFGVEHTVSVSVIDTVMSLGQQDDRTYTVSLMRPDGGIEDSVSYTTALGAKGDGKSLQKINSSWVAALPTSGSANNETGVGENLQTNETIAPAQASQNGVYVSTPKQTIVVDAGNSKQTALVGVDATFKGVVYGLEGEAISNARFLWSFGDGSTKEGKSITHAYQYPGEYVVTLEGSSAGYSSSDKILLTVVPSQISINEIGSPEDFFISIKNDTKYEINLGGWIVRSSSTHFTIPTNTFVLSMKAIRLAGSITKLPFSSDVALLYPNGTVASIYKPVALSIKSTEIISVPPKNTIKNKEERILVSPMSKDSLEKIGTELASSSKEESQTAAILSINTKESGMTKWLFALMGFMLLSLASLFFIFKQSSDTRQTETSPLSANDFKIIEEKES
ncbi:MAG: lamin tail domain-containing protein [bacterium]|nr:lamin tail domain-containing protein [bacterium]